QRRFSQQAVLLETVTAMYSEQYGINRSSAKGERSITMIASVLPALVDAGVPSYSELLISYPL
ncbi:MAG: hypothetical protein R8K48_10460, partial [Gallionella sp.]